MEKHTCKLCSRRFLNGRALGGHMRSHVISASADVSPSNKPTSPESSTPLSYILRENPKKSFRISDPDQYISIEKSGDEYSSSSIVQDQETKNDRNGKRSKQQCKSSPLSSVSVESVELQDVAQSLMLLSRDVWVRSDPKSEVKVKQDSVKKGKKCNFQCESCKKVFKSFQALGGHRASFKRGKGGCVGKNENAEGSDPLVKRNVHQCPFCPRVFGSGQALGGHKRSHIYASSDGNGNVGVNDVHNGGSNVEIVELSLSPIGLIDLNLPATEQDEFDFEVSAVYDGGV